MIGKDGQVIEEERGRIIPIADGYFRAVMLIESRKGAIRANHWHKHDSHVMYLLSGKARYVEADFFHEPQIVLDRVVGPGEIINTKAIVPHAMEFLEDSVMVVCAANSRDYNTYMQDIVPCKIL